MIRDNLHKRQKYQSLNLMYMNNVRVRYHGALIA